MLSAFQRTPLFYAKKDLSQDNFCQRGKLASIRQQIHTVRTKKL